MANASNWKITVRPLANGQIRIRTQAPVGHEQADRITKCIERALLRLARRKYAEA